MLKNFTVKNADDLSNMLRIFRSSAPALKESFEKELYFAAGFAKKLLAKGYMLKASFCIEHMRVTFTTLMDRVHPRIIKVSAEDGLAPEISWIALEGKKINKAFNILQMENADEWYERVLKELAMN